MKHSLYSYPVFSTRLRRREENTSSIFKTNFDNAKHNISFSSNFRLSSTFNRQEQRRRKFKQVPKITILLTNRARVSVQICPILFHCNVYTAVAKFKLSCNTGLLLIIVFYKHGLILVYIMY